MLTLEVLKELAGAERWAAAKAQAFATAPYAGKAGDPELSATTSTAELQWVVDELEATADAWENSAALLDTYLAVYRELPSYAVLFALSISYSYTQMDGEARRRFWAFVREMMDEENVAFSCPVAYVMWCDFFEDPERVEEAWNQLVTYEAPNLRLERVLEVSGPVPFALKERLYDRLIRDRSWHVAIFQSLKGSVFDVYGQYDRKRAQVIFDRLKLNRHVSDLERVREKLFGSA